MSSSLVRNVQRDTVVQRLEHFAAVQPDKVAWTWYDDKLNVQETFTYKEIDQASSHLADTMREQWNIKTNDVVVLVFAPGLQFALSLFACFKAGAIGVPVYPPDPTKAGKELLHFATICQDCGAKFALSHNLFYAAKQFGALSATVMSFFAKRETSWPDLQWFTIDSAVSTGKNTPKSGKTYENAKLAFLQYTSGSTSAPKGVMMTHQNIAANCFATEDCNRKALNGKNIWTTDVIVASWLPMYHDMGLIAGYMLMMYSGGEGHYFSPITFLRAPLQWLRLLHRTKATFTGGPNFSFSMVLKKLREATPEVRAEIKSLDFSHIDVFVNGAEPLEINLFNEFLEEFAPQGIKKTVHAPCYGMAECTLTMAGFGSTVVQLDKQALIERRVVIVKENEFKDGYHAVENTKALVSCGRWSEPIHVVRIVDPETCEDLGHDKIGEIWMNGDSKAAGYWGRSEEANAEVFGAKLKNSKVAAFADLAFLRTGDYGFTHKGQLYITGRMKDMIIVNGFKHYPQDVERSAESANKSLSPGRSAAFAVRDQAGAATESCVIVMELKPDVDPSQYAQICRDVQISVSRECSLYLQGIYLLQPKTICKTTSGKISRNFNAVAYGQKKLKILHSWEDFDSGSAPAPVASVVRAAVEVLSVAEIKAKIVTLLRTVGGVEESVPLDDSTNLIDLGIHSAVITELSVAMATELAVNVRPMTIFSAPSLGGLSARIQQMLKDQANAADRSSNASDIESDAESEINGSTGETGPVEKYEGHIAGWGIATPLPITTERFLEIEEAERRRIGQSEEVISNMKKFVKSSQIVHRYSCQPFWLPEGKTVADYPEAVGVMPHDIYGPAENHNPKYVDRLSCFKHTVLPLCINAAEKALKNWGGEKQEITHIITTCTSGWTEPGIGCAVIKGLKLREDIQKQELNFNGCFCGATCLRIARDFIRAGDATAVMIVACEVASSQANWSYTETELLVMQSLFADGAAAIIVAREGIWRYDMTGSAVVPESSSLLGLRPPQNDNESSYVMTLSPKVAPSLYQYFTSGFGKTTMKKLYNGREQRPALAIHPGGPRILEAMNDVFQEQGFKEGSMDASYHTFRNNGNLGCAAMLFVLAHRLSKNDIEEDSMITMAFGPGVTVEWAKLVRADSAAGRASAQRALSGNASTVCARPVSSLRSSRSATPAVIAEKYRSSPISTKQLALTPPSPATAAAEIEHASTVKELTGMRVNMQRLMIVVLLQSLGLFAALGAVVFLAVRK